jgi:uncharacterized membrane protein YesL
MADVPPCTAPQFLISHQYPHVLKEHFKKAPTIFWKIFSSALLLLLGTVKELPAEGKKHTNSSMLMVISFIWLIVSAFITYDPL